MILLSDDHYNSRWAYALPVLAILILKAYETSLVFCSLLAVMCVWRMAAAHGVSLRLVLASAAALFAAGAIYGLLGVVNPRDPQNAAGFVDAAGRIWVNTVLLQYAALTVLTIVVVFVRGRNLRRDAALVLIVAFAWFVRQQAGPDTAFGLGQPGEQRAQVPFLLLAICGMLILGHTFRARLPEANPRSGALMGVPLAAAFTLNAVDVVDWRYYLRDVCAALRAPDASISDADFFASRRVVKMEYDWEYPTLSVLLRPPGSDRMLMNPNYSGWLPFDPQAATPDISGYQATDGGICVQLGVGP